MLARWRRDLAARAAWRELSGWRLSRRAMAGRTAPLKVPRTTFHQRWVVEVWHINAERMGTDRTAHAEFEDEAEARPVSPACRNAVEARPGKQKTARSYARQRWRRASWRRLSSLARRPAGADLVAMRCIGAGEKPSGKQRNRRGDVNQGAGTDHQQPGQLLIFQRRQPPGFRVSQRRKASGARTRMQRRACKKFSP